MKYILQFIEIIIIVLIITISTFTYNQVDQTSIIKSTNPTVKTYHFAVVTDTVDSYAADSFFNGLDDGVEEFDAVYEIYQTADNDLDDIFKMILMTQVDGVILKLENNAGADAYVQACKEQDLFVVTIGNDSPESKRDVYIGTNKFNTGKSIGELAAEAVDNNGEIAVILGSEYQHTNKQAPNNFISGLYEWVNDMALLDVDVVSYTEEKRAELVMDDILKNNPNVNVVICTDPVDSIRVTRVLVDKNRVGDIVVIASGDTPEIRDSINKRVIEASVVEDYEVMGYLSVQHLYELLNGQGVSSYISIPIRILDKESVLMN